MVKRISFLYTSKVYIALNKYSQGKTVLSGKSSHFFWNEFILTYSIYLKTRSSFLNLHYLEELIAQL